MTNLQRNIPLAPLTTFRIGGPAKYFFVAENKEQVIEAIKWAKEHKTPFFILAKGSNILVSDKGFNGLVIQLRVTSYELRKNSIYVEAGVPLAEIVTESTEAGLTGLEWAVDISGTIGGAIYGNAGAFGHCIGESIESVEVYNNETIEQWNNEKCQFSYRDSVFKRQPVVILSATLKLTKGNQQESEQIIQQYLKRRKQRIPSEASAGCIFKNVIKGDEKISAGHLIDQCGLKGKQIGKAKISEKHANFIVNLGGAKAKEVKELIKLCKKEVKNKFNIGLEEEIRYL